MRTVVSPPRWGLGAAPLDPPFGMAASHVRAADDAVKGVRQRVAASYKNYLGSVGVADALSIRPAIQHSGCRCLERSPGPGAGHQRAVGIGVAEGEPVGEQREREHIRVVGGLGGVDQTGRGGHRLVSGTGDRQCEDQACPGECVGVATACELGAAPLDRPFGLADGQRTHRQASPRCRTAPRRGHCR